MKENRLHLGCGNNILKGWINLDCVEQEGIDVIANLDNCKHTPLPFASNSIDECLGSHVLEHIQSPLALMEELHRIMKPDAKAVFHVPYGSSDNAFEDPTHVKYYFLHSFEYFSQPCYWRADYGYRGDWKVEKIQLVVDANRYQGKSATDILEAVHTHRNVVLEMIVEMRAVKPLRESNRELLQTPPIEIHFGIPG